MQKVLANNNKPPTHFIEVWIDPTNGNSDFDLRPEPMLNLESLLNHTTREGYKTIAIFKIRMK